MRTASCADLATFQSFVSIELNRLCYKLVIRQLLNILQAAKKIAKERIENAPTNCDVDSIIANSALSTITLDDVVIGSMML